MSIFATNWIVDEETGEVKLVKHLNKLRMDHYTPYRVRGWNKSGAKARIKNEKKFRLKVKSNLKITLSKI